MRLTGFLLSLFVLAGVAATQDTNFPVGPQYLVTSANPMFLRPIATPSLSFSAAPAESSVPAETIPTTDQLNPVPTVPVQASLSGIYWGVPAASQAPAESASEIEISSAPLLRPLPPSFVDTGVTAFVTARSLEHLGYGVPLGEVASYFKTHKPRSVRTFTNADIERLHQS